MRKIGLLIILSLITSLCFAELVPLPIIETEEIEEIICPRCGNIIDVNYKDEDTYKVKTAMARWMTTCSRCDKKFRVWEDWDFNNRIRIEAYYPYPIDIIE